MENLEHRHSFTSIRNQFSIAYRANDLRDLIYGGIYGVETKFAIVTGVVGGQLSITVIILGSILLCWYLFVIPNSLVLSSVCTGLAFFIIGSIKSYWSAKRWIYSGLETLTIGASVASLSYYIRNVLGRLS